MVLMAYVHVLFNNFFVLRNLVVLVFILCNIVHGAEFTFELPDNEKQCFHEIIEKDVKATIEYQVMFENVLNCSSSSLIKF